MRVDETKCIGCGNCVDYCPMNAITLKDDCAVIDLKECVECSVCLRAECCPTDALFRETLEYPRDIAHFFSDPEATHPSTAIPGRGTEEMKTNDVTNRFPAGFAGIAIELGRPGVGTRFDDVQKVAMAMAEFDVEFEPGNPVTALMADKKKGTMKEELLDLKVISAIVEFGVDIEKVPAVLARLNEVQKELDTVFSLDFALRCREDGTAPVEGLDLPFSLSINGKSCLGLGRANEEVN